MQAQAAHAALQACGLPQAWRLHGAWRVLDCDFGSGQRFFHTWQAWLADPQRPRLLHYVALCTAHPTAATLETLAHDHPHWAPLVEALVPQCFGLVPGFHRLQLSQNQVLLTLCVGPHPTLLGEQQFAADTVYLHPSPPEMPLASPWTRWDVKALARVCRRGTRVSAGATVQHLQADLAQCGFVLAPVDEHLQGEYAPAWPLRTTRKAFIDQAPPPGICAVVGAGLAGASTANALARRGWKVQVLDQAPAAAAGASGLPVGLVAPYHSADDGPLARLSRAGARLMLQQARQLLQEGVDWMPSAALERRLDGTPGLPAHWSAEGLDWSRPATTAQALELPGAALWHAHAAWVKPAALIRAWLGHANIVFKGNARVASVRPLGDAWELLDARQQVLARASRVVLANAHGALAILQASQSALADLESALARLPVLHGVRGQLSWSWHAEAPTAPFPPYPVHGAGSVIAQVPMPGAAGPAPAWFVGSSYQPDNLPVAPDAVKHGANLARLQRLLPALADALAPQFDGGALQAFKATRCVTSDRLPALGPLLQGAADGLWICAGLGSRGLTMALLCAELLAAQWNAEPWPVETSLARSLQALRKNAVCAMS